MKKSTLLTVGILLTNLLFSQTMNTIPAGLRLITPCHYSYGCAVAPDNAIWFTEFNHHQLRKYSVNSQTEIKRNGIGGMFGMTIDQNNNVFVGLDLGDAGNPGKILRIMASGAESYVVSGITRPRQLTTDTAGNVYFATESPSRISRWNKATGLVDILADNLPTSAEGVAVASTGVVYFSTYGNPENGVAGSVYKRTTAGVVSSIATGFWRARGIALDEAAGFLYLCNEADQGDHGNSGMLTRILISNGTSVKSLEGIDYPQFPCRGADGRIYFTLTRDSWVAAFDPAATTTQSSWPSDNTIKLGLSGGTWSPGGSGSVFSQTINSSLTLNGNIQLAQQGGKVYGWLRIPAGKFTLNPNELYTWRCDAEHPTPGLFELPSVTYRSATGSCLIAAVPLRGHTNQRWPMTNPGTCNETPASGFNESPTDYLVYFAYDTSDRIRSILSPAYTDTANVLTIIKGTSPSWMLGSGLWSYSGQSWLGSGVANSTPSSDAWAENDLGAFAGKSKYIYVMWHKNGPYRPDSADYNVYDFIQGKKLVTLNETRHADGLNHTDDTFSGWYQLGTRKINITPSTRMRISQRSPVGSSEYLQIDAVMLSDYPVTDNTSLGASSDFASIPVLSGSASGPEGVGSHWGMQGLGCQYTVSNATSWAARIDSNVVADAVTGYYYVDISWNYFNTDSLNTHKARYSVNGVLQSAVINQNRSAANQAGSFVQGNSAGTWSGFYRLNGSFYHQPSSPLIVSLNYASSTYNGRRLVADMVRFVPVNGSNARIAQPAGISSSEETGGAFDRSYPNPFSHLTTIAYNITQGDKVSLKVYDLQGHEIARLVNGFQSPGSYIAAFDATHLPPGIYLYRLVRGHVSATGKMILNR